MSSAGGRPRQGFAGLWNISFGFLGIQIGFALQNANMSRVFQSLGESIDNLPLLWIAAPLTGLLVQPVIGHYSDRTWGRFGRRRPYFLAGAVLATLALIGMPNAPVLLVAALLLWVLDASLNVSMEPFRAFVGDMLAKEQHSAGYAIQTAFIGAGAVIGSATPWLLDHFGVSNVAANGGLPDTVRWSFYLGGGALLLAVLWTVLTTREYSPEEIAAFDGPVEALPPPPPATIGAGIPWLAVGVALGALVFFAGLEKELYLLAGLLAAFGLARMITAVTRAGILGDLMGDFSAMPLVMKRLALVQFFSWSALFIMWIYTTPVVAQYVFHAPDTSGALFNEAGNWVGILSAAQNAVATLAALFLLRPLAARFGKARTHAIALLLGALGYAGFLVIRDAQALLFAEIGIGIAWASILAMPYAILASALPQAKLGVYMGLFNVFIVIPQLLVAALIGIVMRHFFPGEPIWTMAIAAVVMGLAALATLRVREA
ncbi:MFS transporter [Sphingomonas sp. OTU376]|uniref:MFS transporter n=1 Tax=Sphingomonas sp. OTU376 TaxID=3043863 RepID=UPI00313D729C